MKWIKKAWAGFKQRWYILPKVQRHFLAIITMMAITLRITLETAGSYNFPLAALVAWAIGLIKEIIENKGFNKAMGYDITLNTLATVVGLIPWFIMIWLSR